MITEQSRGFEALLEHLTRYRGIDFTGYKQSSLLRRVMGRMDVVGVGDCAEYLAYLDGHPGEYTALFDSILINVTGFFRDEAAWGYVRETLLPDLLALKPAEEPVRVWSAGCASGEEIYTLAMLFAEVLGPEAFHHRVKIYATDVDEEALAQARQAVYNDQDLASVPAAFRSRYFETAGSRHVVRANLGRAIVFGRHDVMRDAPISRVDLLVCRNTLMYFDREAQGRILTRFHLALVEAGYLFLGKAELSPAHSHVFQPVSLKHHIFRRVSTPDRHEGAERGHTDAISDRAIQRYPQLGGAPTTRALAETGALSGVGPACAGAPVRHGVPGDDRRTVREPGWSARRLPAVPADLEALNAALLVTNEELETSNAEFESTNEELGSMNEELHSTNEELETLNTDLHRRTTELGTTNSILQSVLAGLRVGVAVVDRHLTVLLWNRGAEELWGLSADEVRGRSLSSPDLGLPAEQMQIAGFLSGTAPNKEMTVDASCRGRPLRCRVTCTPFLGPSGGRAGAVLVMEEEAR
ncbi:MAG: PAS domain-containing protein [Zetaproteobacteria bacterium]|nr:MAG: PAS domain-containing protein [Zetaproteobacteria bacterium]